MNRKGLIFERLDLPVQDPVKPGIIETDSLLSEMNEDLARYAHAHLGYSVLSRTLAEEKSKKQEKATATIVDVNRLPEAINKAEIQIFNRESVQKYQRSMVRKAWFKFAFDFEKSMLYVCLHFFLPLVGATLLVTGPLSGWQACLIVIVSLIPFFFQGLKEIWKSVLERKHHIGLFVFCLLIFLGPTIGIVLASVHSNWWLVATFVVSPIFFYVFAQEFREQIQKSRVYWHRIKLDEYDKQVPLFALDKARQVHQLCSSTKFVIEELRSDIYLPDPFMIAVDPDTKQEFYFEVWDEPKFEAKNI